MGFADDLGALTADAAGKLNVLRHDRHTLGVDSAQIGVLEEANKVRLRSFLQGHDRRRLEPQVSFEVLGDLTDKALEGQLTDKQFSALLVPSDLAESDSPRPVAMGLLHTSSSRSTLPCSFGGELLARGFSASALTSGLLRSCHLILYGTKVSAVLRGNL